MSNIEFLLTYGMAPGAMFVTGLVVFLIVRRRQRRDMPHHTPAE